jgi:hypothetical protein
VSGRVGSYTSDSSGIWSAGQSWVDDGEEFVYMFGKLCDTLMFGYPVRSAAVVYEHPVGDTVPSSLILVCGCCASITPTTRCSTYLSLIKKELLQDRTIAALRRGSEQPEPVEIRNKPEAKSRHLSALVAACLNSKFGQLSYHCYPNPRQRHDRRQPHPPTSELSGASRG